MVEILRVSESGDSVIYKEKGRYYSLDTATHVRSGGMDTITSFTSHGGWRRATRLDRERFRTFVDSGIEVFTEAPSPRKYRLPSSVRQSIVSLDFNDLNSILTVSEMNFLLETVEKNDGLTKNEIADLNSISRKVNSRTSILTAAGQSWIDKVEKGVPALVASNTTFDDDDTEYFAVSPDPTYPTSVNSLYMIDEDTESVYKWSSGEFVQEEGVTADTFSAPSIVPIDNATAQVFALWLDAHPPTDEFDGGMLYNLEESDPAENNLMKSSDDEIDSELGLLSMALVAAKNYFTPTKRSNSTKTLGSNWAKMMVKSYTPAERSANASKQKRNSSGQFSKGGETEEEARKKGKPKLDASGRTDGKKAKLGFVDKNKDSGRKAQGRDTGSSQGSKAFDPDRLRELIEDLVDWFKGGPGRPSEKEESIYDRGFRAEVPKVNIPPSPEELRKRAEERQKQHEEWLEKKKDEDDAESLTSAAESSEEDNNTRYVALVASDDHDAVTDVVALRRDDESFGAWVRSRGEWSDASDILEEILGATPPPMVELTDDEQIQSVLEQVDSFDASVPEQAVETPEESVAASLYSEFGEIYPVSAAADGVRGTQRLKRYWTRGKGAAKIRWGTKGDLTRCHRHLAKYLGPGRAWGYCQNRHQDIFGVSNAERDKAAG